MDDYETIEAAARRQDWHACERLMFQRLYIHSFKSQAEIALRALLAYIPRWIKKHPERSEETFVSRLFSSSDIVDAYEDNDPADAEFANALVEFQNALSSRLKRSRSTFHFATAIRSAVLCRQIDGWMRHSPEQFRQWKDGRRITGPTFLDDELAINEAVVAWSQVGELLERELTTDGTRLRHAPRIKQRKQIERAYVDWEKTLM